MDGTGLLFDALVQYLPATNSIEFEVICLNNLNNQSYWGQAKEIAAIIGSAEVILVAESYSGKIANDLCVLLKGQILDIVFIASFVTVPTSFCKLASLLPTGLINSKCIPDRALSYFCFSGHGDKQTISGVRNVIQSVRPEIIKQRLNNMSKLKLPDQVHHVRSIYIRPTRDRLVASNAVDDLTKIYPDLNLKWIEGGHFIAQTNPKECAKVIANAIAKYN